MLLTFNTSEPRSEILMKKEKNIPSLELHEILETNLETKWEVHVLKHNASPTHHVTGAPGSCTPISTSLWTTRLSGRSWYVLGFRASGQLLQDIPLHLYLIYRVWVSGLAGCDNQEKEKKGHHLTRPARPSCSFHSTDSP